MSGDEAQSSRGEENKYYVFVKHLPYFSSYPSLQHYFRSFGKVDTCSLIHDKEGHYTRTATVKMKSKKSVKKILKKEQHSLDGKQIQVMRYHGMSTPEANVEGKYHVHFSGLVDTSNPSKVENEYLFEKMYKMLEDVFHEFEYIRIFAFRVDSRYDGSAQVSFEDDRNANEIMRIAREKFGDSFVSTEYSSE